MLHLSRIGPALSTIAVVANAAAQTADSANAVTGARELISACRQEAGRLWGKSLCGRLVMVDGETGFAVATERPPVGSFAAQRGLWIGHVPQGMQVANTAMDWSGERWSTVRLPLSTDRFLRIRLLAHESFHRIQPDLGLDRPDRINAHLDERDGRYLLRLELRALSAALTAKAGADRDAARDALLFRARREQLYPGADTLEAALEIQEGLAEYTGARVSLTATRSGPERAARETARFEERPTFVRSLGYGTGPALGLLLDRWAPGWRRRVATVAPARQLRAALRFEPPADLPAAVADRATRYGGADLARAEDERNQIRTRQLADYRARLVDGPVIVLRANGLGRSFNPNALIPLGQNGTIYPTGSFSSEWGSLEVEEGGSLVDPTNREVRVPAPSTVDSTAGSIQGSGWKLELNPQWRLVRGERPGDWIAVKR